MPELKDWLNLSVNLLQAVFVIISILMVKKQLVLQTAQLTLQTNEDRKEAVRRKREATMAMYSSEFPGFKVHQGRFELCFGEAALTKPIDEAGFDKIAGDVDLRHAVEGMLSFFENLGTGVNCGVMDLATVNRLLGGLLVQAWDCFDGYIKRFRSLHQSSRFFDQFELLASDLRTLRTSEPANSPTR